MNQCIQAAESMFNMSIPAPAISPLKRKSIGDASDQAFKKQAVGSPGDASPYSSIPRNVGTHSPGVAQPVNIQPRPNGFPPPTLGNITPVTPISQNVILPPRRRGRPPKAETLARQGASQSSHYAPISPAPIAPSPVQPIAPRLQSPGPSPGSAYQVWSAAGPDAKSKKKRSQPAGDRQLTLPDTVPRTVHPALNSDPDARQTSGPVTEYPEWRSRAPALEPLQGGHGPATKGPTLPPILPPPPSPNAVVEERSRSRETSTPVPLEPTRQGGHAATVD